jgi:peptidoglycan-associated lipoprotein
MRKILYLAPALLAAACASHEAKNETPVAATSATTAPITSASTTGAATQSNVAGSSLNDLNGLLAKRSVYFDFDSNVVKDEYQPLIQAHSRYISSHPESRVRIEGNSDERGSREYNLALGQRRAEAQKRVMVVLGVPESRIETVSFGEEKPAAPGHDEPSWAKNRRDDIRYVVE